MLFFSFCSLHLSAKEEVYKETLPHTSIIAGGSISVNAQDYSNNPDFVDENIKNRVVLRIVHDDNAALSTVAAVIDIAVQLQLTYYTGYNDGNWINPSSETVTLQVSYKNEGSYKDIAVFQLDGGIKLDVSIISVTPTSPSLTLALDAEISLDRYYNFSRTTRSAIFYHDPSSFQDNELRLFWSEINGAEEYELEWAYVNNYDDLVIVGNDTIATYKEDDQVALDKDLFRYNSTKVTLSGTQYQIPLMYESGFLLYRVRAIGVSENNRELFVPGVWSNEITDGDFVEDFHDYYTIQPHERKLNWQYTANFAEEGKRKSTISYFDGSLRNRQTVTKINSQNETVIAEKMYDSQGREVVQILPVPSNERAIRYMPLFNVNEQGEPYSNEDFKIGSGTCLRAPEPLSTESGASKYYSPENSMATEGYHQFIPDAEGYPLSQVYYTPDNTGRINRQSGVGPDHQLGSDRETKYYYVTPSQAEIDRLFGSEAGYASHYKKNIVVDPNGQVSVSYVDMQGKTIATALAGPEPESLQELTHSAEENANMGAPIVTNLIDGNTEQTISGSSKILSREVGITATDQPTFEYTITPNTYNIICDNGTTQTEQCYNCVLELRIRVVDECGQDYLFNFDDIENKPLNVLIGEEEILNGIQNNTYEHNGDCEIIEFSTPNTWGEANTMQVGSYTVSKVLKVNEEALNFYLDEYLAEADCIDPLQKFIDKELEDLERLNCIITCEQCKSAFLDYPLYVADAIAHDEAYFETSDEYYAYIDAECSAFCPGESINCKQGLYAMMADVSPMGQYGLYMDEDGNYNPYFSYLSVFNKKQSGLDKNRLPKSIHTNTSWKNPVHIFKDKNPDGSLKTSGHYYIENNGILERAKVEVFYNAEDATFTPEIDDEYLTDLSPFTETGIYLIDPNQLLKVEDFVRYWPPSGDWAYSLVSYHPEYEYYEYCIQDQDSHDWDNEFMSYKTFDDLVDNNKQVYIDNPMSNDPFFLPGGQGYPVRFIFEHFLENFQFSLDEGVVMNIWETAFKTAYCPEAQPSTAIISTPCGDGCLGNIDLSQSLFDQLNTEEYQDIKDSFWDLYKMLYLSKKQAFQEKLQLIKSKYNGYYNGCIGDTAFSPTKDNFISARHQFTGLNDPDRQNYYHAGFSYGLEVFNKCQPCNLFRARLYRNKTARYPKMSSLSGSEDELDAEVCYEEPPVDLESSVPAGAEFNDLKIVDCASKNQLVLEATTLRNQAAFMDECGQCPISLDLTDLIRGVFHKRIYLNSRLPFTLPITHPLQLSCMPQGIGAYNDRIREAMNIQYTQTSSEHMWEFNINDGGNIKSLVADIKDGSTVLANVVLKTANSYEYMDPTTGATPTIPFNWEDVIDVCCMEYMESGYAYNYLTSSEYTTYETKRFSIVAIVRNDLIPNSTHTHRVTIEGYTDKIVLNECPFSICRKNGFSTDMLTFFQTAILKLPPIAGNPISQNIFTRGDGSEVLISETENDYMYQLITDNIKNCKDDTDTRIFNQNNSEWYYTSTLVGSILHATLADAAGNEIEFTFELNVSGDVTYDTFNLIEDIDFRDYNFESNDPERQLVLSVLGTFNGTMKQRVECYFISQDVILSDCTDYDYMNTGE